jgi:hypothetical protein
MPSRAPLAARVLLPFALHGLAREVDAAVGVLLHTSLDLPRFVPTALSLVDWTTAALHVLLWTLGGAVAWVALAHLRARATGMPADAALDHEARGFAPLYLRPALTLLALASLAVSGVYPYGFTLPVALTQDWGIAQDVAAAAALLAWRRPRLRLPAPGPVSVAFLAFLAYAFLAPGPARRWENHPGNEPKTLRMAVAAGHWMTFDTERVSTAMEDLPTDAPAAALLGAFRTMARESARMMRALLPGPPGAGREAIAATRVTRQTVRGKEGGIYTVLAPGPSVLLAPFLRLDRAWNRAHGTPGRLAFTLLFWNAVGGALVGALFLLLRDASGRPGLAAALALLLALLPPLVFYSFQFYPETLGALALALLLRWLLFVPRWGTGLCLALGLTLAALPWLHQKFLPVWLVLGAAAVVVAVHRLVRLPALLALVLPQLASGYLVALYNFTVTGSVRPDALYLAWGPAGITGARVGQGLLGLLFDARYGLLPYVPLLALGFGGLLLKGPAARRLWLALPAALAYYVTVAAADNWSGAVCNLGRYAMPVLPYLSALLALLLARAAERPALAALALTLAGWSAVMARLLWRDPDAANDCAVLLARSHFADGNVYLPNLFIRSWADGAPGLWLRLLVALALVGGAALWARRCAEGRAGASAPRALAALFAILLAAALLLERWPGQRTAARFDRALELGPGTTAYFSGRAEADGDAILLHSGTVTVLSRAREDVDWLRLQAEGEGVLRVAGRPPLALAGSGTEVRLPVEVLRRLAGRRGVQETLRRQEIDVRTQRGIWLRAAPLLPPQ